jgi:hypothetical protein
MGFEETMARVPDANSRARRKSGSMTAASGARSFTGTKRTASAAGASRSSASSTEATFVVCVDPAGHDDLQSRRLYQVLPDSSATRSRFIRVIDDSGEDYVYPAACFLAIDLPKSVKTALALPIGA